MGQDLMSNVINMATENNALPGIDKETIDLINKFKLECPVKKLNFSNEDPRHVFGIWIIRQERALDMLRDKADLSGLNDHTILIFSSRHAFELANVLNGMLSSISGVDDVIDDEFRYAVLNEFMLFCNNYHTNFDFNEFCDNLIYEGAKYHKDSKNVLITHAQEIFRLLPFISYNELDNFCHMAIDDIKRQVFGMASKKAEAQSNESD